jgi:hypothetical protein
MDKRVVRRKEDVPMLDGQPIDPNMGTGLAWPDACVNQTKALTYPASQATGSLHMSCELGHAGTKTNHAFRILRKSEA